MMSRACLCLGCSWHVSVDVVGSGFRSVPSFLCGKFSFKFAAYNFPCVCDVTNYVGNFPPRVIFSCVSKISSVTNSSPQLRNKEWNSN
jgi:hypothetical protein